MIEIKNLTKVYKSRKTDDCIAINDLTFSLPNKGMIFIIGKSGSGKSTLLNMLGGLDTITSGEIIADGNNLSEFSVNDFNMYRSSYIGFIFQHYHLLDDLTISQNLQLVLDISNIKDEKLISEMLKKVDLEGYENRYPKELSGGQKQRVAIARALAKNPSLILGDEPTGNLDNKTSAQILDLLKEVSKEKLVVIVSHNLAEADQYADRIIELHDGKISSDKERRSDYNNDFKVTNSTIRLPHYRDLSAEELEVFINELPNSNSIIQNDNGFIDYKRGTYEYRKKELVTSQISNKSLAKISSSFLHRRKNNIIVTICLTCFLFMLIAMLQSFYLFSPVVSKNDNVDDIILNKGLLNSFDNTLFSAPLYSVSDEDIDRFYDAGYEGNIYKLYATSLHVGEGYTKINYNISQDYQRNFESFYISETYGTLNCSEEYLIEKYGVDGKLVVLAGDLYSCPYGNIITDYVADSILKKRPTSYRNYDDIIDKFVRDGNYNYGYISAIIDTNYEEKYRDIIKEYESRSPNEYSELYLEQCSNELYQEFIKEAYSYLGIGYNFNPNYEQAIKINELYTYIYIRNAGIYSESKEVINTNSKSLRFIDYEDVVKKNFKLSDDEIALAYSDYNNIFKTSFTTQNLDTFVPHKITLEIYVNEDPKQGILFKKEFNITKLVTGTSVVSSNVFKELHGYNYYAYGLYFDNPEYSDLVISVGNKNYFYVKHIYFDNLLFINKIVNVFKPFFMLVLILLFITLLIYLVSFGINNIKRNLYEIGIIKSLGGASKDIGKIFISHVLLTGIIICIFSIVLAPTIILLANEILINSFENVMSLYLFDVSIIKVVPKWISLDLLLMIIIIFISAFIPMSLLYKIKPLEIIKSKE